ncbi:MAG: cysteate synthase [Lentimicrobiaceae bacterium]|nr:cysteate synthase [Lentimicrobiaceae bacterium]
MENFKATRYQLKTIAGGRVFNDGGWVLDDPQCELPSLVRALYEKKQLDTKDLSYGIYRFADWLPINRCLKGSCAPITYKSEKLAQKLGLENLYITFNGYFPKIGATMNTCSFKETEAYSVCGRLDAQSGKVLVVASAGNTARAFAKVCSENNIPLLLSVPEDNLSALWFDAPLNDCVKLISCCKGGDYFDAIHLSNLVLKSDRFLAEGGAKNIARRDGMGTTVLSAVTFIGQIPDFYFQAVGSGTGAIAAWEANLRLIEDGRFGNKKMRLMVSQNNPFLPMYTAWKAGSRALPDYDDGVARRDAETILAKVLSNRKPPYGLAGGLFDALKDTDGDILKVTNAQLEAAQQLFEQTEGVDIHPAAGVALHSLIESVQNGTVKPQDTVMLNITGGGEKLYKQNRQPWMLKPQLVFPLDPDPDVVLDKVSALFA